jgi:hypothetical protein
MSYLRYPMLASLALVLASCGDSTKPGGGGCDFPPAITVGSGTAPTFDWSPSCTVSVVEVVDLNESDPSAQIKWHVFAEQNIIRPPVSYGSTPAGAIQGTPPAALLTGGRYSVILFVQDPVTGSSFNMGSQQFEP